MTTHKISKELARDVLQALGGADLARGALERGELADVESLNVIEVLECHEVELGDLSNLFIIIEDALKATKKEELKERRKDIKAARKAEEAKETTRLEEIKDSLDKRGRRKLLDLLNKDANNPPPQRLLLMGVFLGGLIGAYILNWTPVGETAYLMTQGQLVTWVICVFVAGLILPTALQYPFIKFKKWQIERMGKQAVIIEYQFRSGPKTFKVIEYTQQININNGRHVLQNPAFTFMGIPGYRVVEGVLTSLDFDYSDIERQIDTLAADMETETTYEGDDGKKYTLVPRGDVLAAMAPANLLHQYNYGLDLGLDKGSTDAEKNIKLIIMLSGMSMLAAIVAAWYSYYGFEGLAGMGKALNNAVAYLEAMGAAP